MKFDKEIKKSEIVYLYDNENPDTAKPTVRYNLESKVVVGTNTNTNLVGLSDRKNTPIKSLNGLAKFHSVEITVNKEKMYYWTK